VMDGISEQILSPRLQEVRLLDGLPKEELELWTNSAEVGCGGKGEVELEATGQEKHSVDRLAGGKVKKLVGGELCHEFCGPVLENRSYGESFADSEPQVEIRPAIAWTGGHRADDGSGDNAVVGGDAHSRTSTETLFR
jgi:hypothetical protein